MDNFDDLVSALASAGLSGEQGLRFTLTGRGNEENVLRIEIEGQEELPIFLGLSPDQIIAMVFLFNEAELDKDKVAELNELMLLANTSIPFSSFAKLGERYLLYGALSAGSGLEVILEELTSLSLNAVDALETFAVFLKTGNQG